MEAKVEEEVQARLEATKADAELAVQERVEAILVRVIRGRGTGTGTGPGL